MSTYATILDFVILCVLGLTIFFCWKLNNRITELQSNKSEMVNFIKSLDATIISAHKSVVSLKEATQDASNERQKYIAEGNELANDLSFMIDSGKRLMSRIERMMNEMKDLEESGKVKTPRKKKDTVKKISKTTKSQISEQ